MIPPDFRADSFELWQSPRVTGGAPIIHCQNRNPARIPQQPIGWVFRMNSKTLTSGLGPARHIAGLAALVLCLSARHHSCQEYKGTATRSQSEATADSGSRADQSGRGALAGARRTARPEGGHGRAGCAQGAEREAYREALPPMWLAGRFWRILSPSAPRTRARRVLTSM